jgi:hypothetical protein
MSLDRRAMGDALPNYEIGRELGRGAFGIVYEGHHRHLDRRVAIKQLPRALAADPTSLARFLTEAKTAAALQHSHIVPVYDFTEKDGLCLLVMEHLGGGSLTDQVGRAPFGTATACRVVVDIADALHYAHLRGVLHRDVKPDNIIFSEDGVPKLGDFGIAKLVEQPDRLTMTGTVVGTPAYLAPEVAMGDDATPASDVYALGVVLYELLAHQLPFPARATTAALLLQRVSEDPTPIGEVTPGVDPALAEVVMRSIARDPAQRYPTAEAFADLLRPFAAAPDVVATAIVSTTAPSSAPTAAPMIPADPVGDPLATQAPRQVSDAGMATQAPRHAAEPTVDVARSDAPSRGRRRMPVLVAAAVLAVLAVVAAIVLAGGGGDETAVATDPGTTPATTLAASDATTTTTAASTPTTTVAAPTSTLPPGLATVTEATVRFREGCTTLYTAAQCDCAIERIQRELGLVAFVDISKDLERDRRINRPQAVAIMAQCAASR